MVARDRTCQYPFCIQIAPKTCSDCGNWMCVKHLQSHSCKKVEAWQASGSILNALKPDQLSVDDKGKVTVELDPKPRKKPTRKSWHDIIEP